MRALIVEAALSVVTLPAGAAEAIYTCREPNA